MAPPLVNVCMPAYNYGQYIERSVRSVFAQTHRPPDLVVVDDGSTDDTWSKLEALKAAPPIPVKLLHGAHKGVSAALNLAMASATGEWISILHADDTARSDRIERQLAVTSPKTVLVHSDYVCIDESDALTGYDSSVDLPPVDEDALRGDATKARTILGWKPKIGFVELTNRMVDSDLELAAREKRARG